MKRIIVVASALCLAFTLAACSDPGESVTSETDATANAVAEETTQQKAEKQVFETELGSAEYRDTQDVAGNTMVTFAFANKTDHTVMVSSQNLVANGEFSIGSLGGAPTPIQPGTTGSVSLVFGLSAQSPLTGTSELQSLSGELLVIDNDSFDQLGTIPFSIVI